MGKARTFSDSSKDPVYQKEYDDEIYSSAQQNSYNLGSTHFSDQSGIGNFTQSGTDQRKANIKGALFRGNVGFDLQTALLDVGTNTIDLNNDSSGTALSLVSTDRFVTLSSGTTADLITITGAQRPGQRLRLYNTLTNTVVIKHTAAATVNTIRTSNAADLTILGDGVVDLTFDITTAQWRVVSGGGGAGTGTFVSAALSADQITNLAIGQHVEFDTNTPPLGADGLIVLQTGAGQADGIFELKQAKTYFLSAAVAPLFGAANHVEFVWYDITNATELGVRVIQDDAVLAIDQPKAEIIYTPLTDVTVELRLVANTTPANLNGYDSDHTFAHIFEFSGKNGADGAPGTDSAPSWKLPARAKTLIDVPTLATFDVITDGVTLVEDDRVLLTEQTTSSENGIYDVGVVAAGVAPLTRSSDLDDSAELIASIFIAIEEGTTNANNLWQLISNNPLTIGVSDQVWEEYAPGISGSPDLGGGEDGIDGSGEWVYDGRVATGNHITKRWEQGTAYTAPNNGANDIIWLPPVGTTRGRLVIVGDSTSAINASYSDDLGDTWTNSAGLTSNDNYIRSAYDPVGNVLVTVSTDGTTTNIKERSTDRGANYGNITSPNTDNHDDILWSSDDSLFVATCRPTNTQGIQTSPAGVTWTVRTTPAPLSTLGFWKFIAYSSSQNLYVSTTGANDDVMTSSDAITWTAATTNITMALQGRLIYSPGQDKFVIVGRASATEIVSWTSKDGLTWTEFTIDTFADGLTQLNNVVWSPSLSLYVAVGSTTATGFNGAITIWISNDAETWTRISRPVESVSVAAMEGIASAEEYGQFVTISQTVTEQIFRTFR